MPFALLSVVGPAGNQAVEMDVLAEVLTPGVEHRSHAQLAGQAFRILSKTVKGVPDRLKQPVINDLRVALRPAIEAVGQGEHQVEIRRRQEVLPPSRQPVSRGAALTPGTMTIAAGAITRLLVVTAGADEFKRPQGMGATAADQSGDLGLLW